MGIIEGEKVLGIMEALDRKVHHQPDFTHLFFQTFKDNLQVRYATRMGANFAHDVIFISSLIHDAVFDLNGITKKEDTLTINLTRLRWELAEKGDTERSPLEKVQSSLKFNRVRAVQWTGEDIRISSNISYIIPADFKENEKKSYEITKLFIGEDSHLTRSDTKEIILTGAPYFWKLRVWTDDEEGEIILEDVI